MDLLARHGARLVEADDDRPLADGLDGVVLAAHGLLLGDPSQRVEFQLGHHEPGQLRRQQPADVAARLDAHHVVESVRDLLPLFRLRDPPEPPGQLADPAERWVGSDSPEECRDGRRVVTAGLARPHPQCPGRLPQLGHLPVGLGDGTADGPQGRHLVGQGVARPGGRTLRVVLLLLLVESRELLGEVGGRDRRGGVVQSSGGVQGVVLGRIQQLADELVSPGVGARLVQPRVRFERG